MSELIEWITRLFADCLASSPRGVAWELDRGEPPLVVTVMPADMPAEHVTLGGDDVRGRISFAGRLQRVLDIALDRPVPSCPTHGLGLVVSRVGNDVEWTCPRGDFLCAIGDYELSALWPPTEADGAAALLARRFEEFAVTGLSWFSVADRNGEQVARVAARPDANEQAIRDAAAPLPVEIVHAPGISTVREWRPATARQPAHELLGVRGVGIRAARLEGELRRAAPGDDCDFLVGSTRVRLAAAHVIGGPGHALLQDSEGVPFADEGDWVSCGGGTARSGPVRGEPPVFDAGQISVERGEPAAGRRPCGRSAAATSAEPPMR